MEINVAYWSDENFVWHTYISIYSILIKMKKNDILNCYLLTKTPNKNIPLVKNLEKKFSNFKLNIVSINNLNLDCIKTSEFLSHINSSTYYRFWVSLIDWINKIIYIDSDTIILGDITSLFKMDLYNSTVWVCSDMPKNIIKSNIIELWLKRMKYFNAWIMLIDLNKWKNKKISDCAINLANKREYKFSDQDVLNIILQDECKYLPWKYNVQSWYFPWSLGNYTNICFKKEYYEKAIDNPIIIHFTWKSKPWKLFCYHFFSPKYYSILLKAHPKIFSKWFFVWIYEVLTTTLTICRKEIWSKILQIRKNNKFIFHNSL